MSLPEKKRDTRLLFGPIAAALLTLGIVCLGLIVPDYSHIRQTVSEIGEVGSPARLPFAILLCCVAGCILVFALAVGARSRNAGHSRAAAWLIGCMAVSAAGVGVFAYPHSLHNVFGISELIGYQAPLLFALGWRRDPAAKDVVSISWIFYALVCLALVLNLSSLDRQGALWIHLRPVYGVAQRALFAAWFGWCATVGIVLFQKQEGK